MNRMLIVSGLAMLAGASVACAQPTQSIHPPLILAQAASTRNLEQGVETIVTPEERKKLQAERAAKRQASASHKKPTFAEREKQAAKEAKNTPTTNLEQGTTTVVSAEQRKQLQAQRVAKKEATAELTAQQRKAAAKEKGKATLDVAKGATGD